MISIITPFKDSDLRFFKVCIESVLSQTYQDFEWILIDDSSNSEYLSQLSVLITDSRCKIVSNEFTKGAGGARNTGLQLARGKYVCFIDSDDYWYPEFLESSLSFLRANGYASCYSGYRRFDVSTQSYLADFRPKSNILSKSKLLSGCDISCLAFFGVWDFQRQVYFGEYRARNDLVFFYRHLEEYGCSHRINLLAGVYIVGRQTISSKKLRLIKYQYLVNRALARKSRLSSLFNVVRWMFYGYAKYKS